MHRTRRSAEEVAGGDTAGTGRSADVRSGASAVHIFAETVRFERCFAVIVWVGDEFHHYCVKLVCERERGIGIGGNRREVNS